MELGPFRFSSVDLRVSRGGQTDTCATNLRTKLDTVFSPSGEFYNDTFPNANADPNATAHVWRWTSHHKLDESGEYKTGDLAFIATVTGTPITKELLEIGFAMRARPPAFPAPRMGCARPARRGPRTMAQPWRSLKRSSDERRRYGFALHASSRPDAACKRGYGKVIEGKTENIYSLTGKQGEGMTPKKPTNSRT